MSEFKCEECGKHFKHKYILNRHMLNHGKQNFKCLHCLRLFTRSDRLSRHKKTCQPDVIHRCFKCQKQFKRKFDLKRHEKICKKGSISCEDGKKTRA